MAKPSHDAVSTNDEDEIEQVVSVKEIHRMTDLGLGRGVDSTNPRPWKNKTSFQVRVISSDLANIIGTDEGGAHQYFEEEIFSIDKQQIEAKLSVEEPTAGVSLGVAGEYSRSTSKTRIAVGEKVVTRTISFRADFDDLPINSVNEDILKARLGTTTIRAIQPPTEMPMFDEPTEMPMLEDDEPEDDDSTSPEILTTTECSDKEKTSLRAIQPPTEMPMFDEPEHDSTPPEILITTECRDKEKFESKLSDWILDRIKARQEKVTKTEDHIEAVDTDTTVKVKVTEEEVLVQNLKGSNPIQKLADYIHSISTDSCQMQQIAQDCYEFIALLGITHYVYAIKLGAVRFQTYTLSEYNSKASTKAKLGAEGFAKASLEQGSEKQDTDKTVNVREIGKIGSDRTVKRRPGNEAVINIQLVPIHTLVHLSALNEKMREALRKYINERADKSEGPFLISSGDGNKRIYWKVNKNNKVVGVQDVTAASIFYATQTDDSQHPHEFFIEYYGEDDDARKRPRGLLDPMSKTTTLAPLAKFLDTRASIFGNKSGPLEVKNHVYEEDARLRLQSRVFGSYNTPFSVESWTAGEEYFLNCSRRRFKVDGYLAMRQNQDYDPQSEDYPSEKFKFITAIVPSVSSHDNVTTWMLFRLLPSEYRKQPALVSEESKKEQVEQNLKGKESTKGAYKPSIKSGWQL